ncbi:MAG: histidinol-phosphate transaminase, partial [Gammaproteobacteria bacterium]|nr:histidinol-phosphate transaminase [Gammaproteobacteria bacterium]
GNGSDELIQMLLMAVAESGRTVLAPEPTFVMYKMITSFVGMDFVGIPLDSNFNLDMDALVKAIEQYQPAVVFLAYPNNPTGNLWSADDIRKILHVAPGFVVVDEAYHVFAEESFMGHIPEHENLLVMRTVSKMGLAGLRLGLMAGDPKWIREINKVRLPYNINVLTQHAASFILQHSSVLHSQAEQLRHNRDDLLEKMAVIKYIEQVYPSQANFILFRVAPGCADKLFKEIKDRGVLIKNMSPAGGALADCLRVTVSTAEENGKFMDALKAGLAAI